MNWLPKALAVLCFSVGRAGLQIVEENDAFVASDRYYTQGLEFRYAESSEKPSWSLFSLVSTPGDITARTPDPEDRPYGGLLAVGRRWSVPLDERAYLDQLVLVGIVGPHSAADDAQRTWHEQFGFVRPEGWAHQLRDEPAVNYYGRAQRDTIAGRWVRAGPYGTLAAGTMHASAGAGVSAMAGIGMPNASAWTIEAASARRGLVAYVDAAGGGKYVAHNIWTDGSVMRDGPGVRSEPWVGEYTFGGVLGWRGAREYAVGFHRTYRSAEHVGQDGGAAYGTITLRLRW